MSSKSHQQQPLCFQLPISPYNDTFKSFHWWCQKDNREVHSSPTSLGAVSGYQTSTFILEGFAFIVSTCMYVWKRFTEAWTTKHHSGYSMGTLVVGSMKVSGKRTRKKDSFYRERERDAAVYCYIVGESWFSLPTPVQSSVPFLWIFVDVAFPNASKDTAIHIIIIITITITIILNVDKWASTRIGLLKVTWSIWGPRARQGKTNPVGQSLGPSKL